MSEEIKDDADGDEEDGIDSKDGKDDNYKYEADVENYGVVERDHVMNVDTQEYGQDNIGEHFLKN